MSTGHEDEFRRLFVDEAAMRLAALGEQAIELEQRGPDAELVDEMFRHAHTVKGGAAVVGFGEVADVVHELEDLIGAIRDRRRAGSPREADAILRSVDALRAMIAAAIEDRDVSESAAAAREALAGVGAAVPPSAPPVLEREPEPDPGEGPGIGSAVVTAARAGGLGDAAPADRRKMDRDSIAVPVGRLDELVRLVGEGAAAQLRVGRLLAERLGDEPGVLDEYRELSRVLGELQEKAMRARMVSLQTIAAPLRRAVRDIARSTGKQVRWDLEGADTELDRHVLEALREPLVALVRNAVDHGIEPPEERERAGKDPAGNVRVHAMQIGSDVVVTVGDDGRGVDLDAVRGAVSGRRSLDDAQALAAIFDAGVSTARAVTDISGRGVGLDAVRAAVDALRGRVEVHSTVGRGSEFRISVPMTLAILRCLLVSIGGQRYAIPMHAAVSLLAPGASDGLSAEGRPAVWVDGDAVPLADLATVLGQAAPAPAGGPSVVLTAADGRHAFRVDHLAGQRDVVVKELPRLLPRSDLLAGASVEPDGSIMLVLDPTGVIEAAALELPRVAPEAAAEAARARVLVVDDALTIRELQRSILERAGYEVVTAASGADALARIEERAPDLVLTDVEMPGMDGFALTRRIRATPASADIPVIVLTSRASEEDRRHGMEAGADAYLVKSSFDEHGLLRAVGRLLGEDPA